MDFDKILSAYKSKTCIISVDSYQDGGYGNIRIAAGNKAHCDDMMNVMHRPFIPDSPYEDYLPQNRNFEDFCYRSAILGQPLHTYVELPQMGLWLNMFLLPLESDRENTGYCIYSYEVTPHADSEQRASLSADTATDVLQTCIKLRGASDASKAFDEVVEDIRRICDSDHCCILLTDDNTRSCQVLCESVRPGSGLLPMTSYLDERSYDVAESWNETIGDSTCVIVKDDNDKAWLREVNPGWYDSLFGAGARNIVLFPLKYNCRVLGYMWALNFNAENTVKIKETLELTTFFLASEISNYLLLRKLETLSELDMLTGVMNRNAMNTYVTDLVENRIQALPYAVVFADLNGLKRVNDEQGHAEGDQMLKRAADILVEVFDDADVYRAGGDEFMIVIKERDQAALEREIRDINRYAEDSHGIHFAVGTYIIGNGEDIREAMRIADERMYNDKKEYYESHPERKYR